MRSLPAVSSGSDALHWTSSLLRRLVSGKHTALYPAVLRVALDCGTGSVRVQGCQHIPYGERLPFQSSAVRCGWCAEQCEQLLLRPDTRDDCIAKGEEEMTHTIEPRLLPASLSKGCAFCEQPAQSQWVGGDELDEVIVPCCREHVTQARERWEATYARFNEDVES
jgi:hypothetical protein